MKTTATIVASIRRRAAEMIVDEALMNGFTRVANAENCIAKVKNELGIDMIEASEGSGVLIIK